MKKIYTVLFIFLVFIGCTPDSDTNNETPFNIKNISVGLHHVIALNSDQTIWGWGANWVGQLGNGTNVDSLFPVQEYLKNKNWHKISTLGDHVLALKTDGTLWSWGGNTSGKLGNGTSFINVSIPAHIDINSTYKSICTGYNYSVGIKTDGTLWAWGDNQYGQLGSGDLNSSKTPIQEITYSTDWTSVYCGYAHTVAVKEDGTLWAWGKNNFGQIGDGTTEVIQIIDHSTSVEVDYNHSKPKRVDTNITSWNTILATDNFTMAIDANGTLWYWGANITGHSSLIPKIDEVNITNIEKISISNESIGVIKTDGSLWMWGNNLYGELGDGTQNSYIYPVQEASHSLEWKDVFISNDFSLAVKSDNSLWGWGYNYWGVFGNGTTNSSFTPIKLR